MKKSVVALSGIFIVLLTFLSGCSLIGGIFKAGIWVGILLVVVVVGIIVMIASKVSKK